MGKLSSIVRLQISLRLGKKVGIKEFMDCINTEFVARENYEEYLK